MKQIVRTITSSPESVLNAIEGFAHQKYKKLDITRDAASVTIFNKLLWQKQTTVFSVSGAELTVSYDVAEAYTRAIKTIQAVEDDHLSDAGWSEMMNKHGIKRFSNMVGREQVLGELRSGETVAIAISGLLVGKQQTIVATDRRIIMLESSNLGFSGGSRTISLDKISSVSVKTGFAFADVLITTSNEEIKIEKTVNAEAVSFVDVVRDLLDAPSEPAHDAPAVSQGMDVDSLQKLAELHAQGILTDEEFAAAKAKALGL